MKNIVWGVFSLAVTVGLVGTAAWGLTGAGEWLIVGAAAPAILLVLWLGRRHWRRAKAGTGETRVAGESKSGREPEATEPRRGPPAPAARDVAGAEEPAELAKRMLQQGRYALLLRPQVAANLDEKQLDEAIQWLDEAMGLVPEGDVLLQSWRDAGNGDERWNQTDRLVHVEALYLDRHCVSNEQYYQFVADGGYENVALWDQMIWPAVLEFVDRTGYPGPRFWAEGCYPPGLEKHPVVGVSWYEGMAYARWVGKRLPSDPEWVKAGCWPVLAQGTRPVQRRYPWGDTLDRDLANLWGNGVDGTVAVDAHPGGVSVGGIYQLIGNVWEWTTSSFGMWDTTARRLETPTPMKSIRGAAFDTYFDTQATCQFQSGDSPVKRKHNIGFRCALAMCDVVSHRSEKEDDGHQELVARGANAEEAVQ
ncbi:MAG: formylglycine-generating enzyme family protein [Planctomycetota bacterium]